MDQCQIGIHVRLRNTVAHYEWVRLLLRGNLAPRLRLCAFLCSGQPWSILRHFTVDLRMSLIYSPLHHDNFQMPL